MSVLVFVESREGKFKKAIFELVSYANHIAQNLNISTTAVTIGKTDDAELDKLGNYGASKTISILNDKLNDFTAQAYTSAITQVAKAENASVIIFSNNYTGIAVAPRVTVKLNGALAAAVVAAPQSYEPFIVRKKAYSGKAFADVQLNSEVKLITLNINSFGLVENAVSVTKENFEAEINDTDYQSKPIERKVASGKVPITEAELLVSGGRGMKGGENWGMLEELAELLGASTACSKPVADIEWRPHEEHVGQTGKTVAPNLYIAIGISGAIQHLAGINASKFIVAINNDPEAPIFEAADYGIVGDAFDVVPKLVESVRKLKNS